MKLRAALLALGGLLAALPAAAPAQPGHAERVEHHDAASPPSRGPQTALVTIEVFFGPTLSARRAVQALEALQAAHPSRIRLVYRVVAQGGQVMVPSALLEAQAEGQFFPMLDALFARTSSRNLDRAGVLELAARLGLDPRRVTLAIAHGPEALDDNAARLRRVHRQAPDALFNGVPLERNLGTYLDDRNPRPLDEAYRAALETARDLVDRGAAPADLPDAVAQEALAAVDATVQPSGETDDDVDVEPTVPPLATPPLDLTGLPTFGRADAPLPIVLLCSPLSTRCGASIAHAIDVQRVYPDDVRVVWYPYFDVARADAVDLGLLADAALCAERVGTAAGTDTEQSSSGWRWITEVLDTVTARHNRAGPAQATIDTVAKALHVDAHAFAACRAGSAGSAVDRITAARHSGARGTPTTVVGGRLYLRGLPDATALQRLVEAELAPGVLGRLAPSWVRATAPDSRSR